LESPVGVVNLGVVNELFSDGDASDL
jgi:hypothetical protein